MKYITSIKLSKIIYAVKIHGTYVRNKDQMAIGFV